MSLSSQLPSREVHDEALLLAKESLDDIELSRQPLENIVLKAGRLARMLRHQDFETIFQYEAGGYPFHPDGGPQEVWRLAVKAGRSSTQRDILDKDLKERAYSESVSALEKSIETLSVALAAARDPDVSVSSANPLQMVPAPHSNYLERMTLLGRAATATERLAQRRAFVAMYLRTCYQELRFSGLVGEVFSETRAEVDSLIASVCPVAAGKLSAAYDGLRSDNPEDWSNAVHSCRRVLVDVANAVFPPCPDRTIQVEGGTRIVRLDANHHLNRLVTFVSDRSASESHTRIVGTGLTYFDDWVHAVADVTEKASHATLADRKVAERYVIYCYLLVGDILRLCDA